VNAEGVRPYGIPRQKATKSAPPLRVPMVLPLESPSGAAAALDLISSSSTSPQRVGPFAPLFRTTPVSLLLNEIGPNSQT
jgi:hypothetical protein